MILSRGRSKALTFVQNPALGSPPVQDSFFICPRYDVFVVLLTMIVVENKKETAPKRSRSEKFDYTAFVLHRLTKGPQLPPCPSTTEEQREWADYHFEAMAIWRDYVDPATLGAYIILDDLWTNSIGTNQFKIIGPQKFFLTTTFRTGGTGIHVATSINEWEKYTSAKRLPSDNYNSFAVEDAIELLVITKSASVCDPASTIELLEMQVASALGAGFCPPREIYLVDREKIIVTIETLLQNISYLIDWEMCANILKIPNIQRRPYER